MKAACCRTYHIIRRHGTRFFLALGLWLSAGAVMAQPLLFTLHVDNDVLYGTDREYTGGFKFKFTKNEFRSFQPLFSFWDDSLSSYGLKPSDDQMEIAVEAFTLTSIQETDRLVHELNEAWTHVDLRRYYRSKAVDMAVGLSLGWLGPNSPGKELQNDLHKLIGNGEIDQANHSLLDQPTLQLNLDIHSPVWRSQEWSLYKSAWLKLGSPTTQGYLGMGLIRRVNSNPVFLNNQVSYVRPDSQSFGFFYFGSAGVSYLGYSALVDGRVFSDDKPILDRYQWIPMVEYGTGFSYRGFAMTLSGNVIGQVYKNQPEESFHFASLTMTWAF